MLANNMMSVDKKCGSGIDVVVGKVLVIVRKAQRTNA